jgi:hypothetical protein
MRFLNILLGITAAGSALAAPTCDAPTRTTKNKRAAKFQFVGVNQSGAEFGKDSLPGQLNKHYVWPTKSSIDVNPPLSSSLEVRGEHGRSTNAMLDAHGPWDEHFPSCHHDVRRVLSTLKRADILTKCPRERLIPGQMTGSVNATYSQGLTDVCEMVSDEDI